jgi:hypothetical protein
VEQAAADGKETYHPKILSYCHGANGVGYVVSRN